MAGAPIIARQLLRNYDQQRLDVLCDDSWYGGATDAVRASFLPCRHTSIPTFRTMRRPRRVFTPVETALDCLRLPYILRVARRIIHERKVEALFTTSWGAELPHAAYFLSKEFGLPFYYFEMDRLDTTFANPLSKWLILRHRREFLRHAEKLWLISPAMIREFRRLFGVEGVFLHNFLDVERYQTIVAAAAPPPSDRIRIIYTGSLNAMFLETARWFCDLLNRGVEIDGRPVELDIYSSFVPPGLVGPRVADKGFVSSEQIPEKLAGAHVAAILISFDAEPGVRQQIETSVYTKTVDYLAASRPLLIVGPSYAAEIEHFGSVACVVGDRDETALLAALRRLVTDTAYAETLRHEGLARARAEHSLQALDERFLSEFRVGV